MDLKIQEVSFGTAEYESLLALRKTVFVREQNVPEQLEIENEESSTFFLGTIEGQSVVTGRYRKKQGIFSKIERVATLKEFRGRGYGIKLMNHMLNHLIDKFGKETLPFLNSQESAVSFYDKLKFQAIGEAFYEANIKHLKMVYLEHRDEQLVSDLDPSLINSLIEI